MVPQQVTTVADSDGVLAPGTILVNWVGQIRILRSRTADGTGWNCADGAAISDANADDRALWTPYSPELLAADLALGGDVRRLGGSRVVSGGLATWDACSGRPCVLPKLAKLVR